MLHTEIEKGNQSHRLELVVPVEGFVLTVFLIILCLGYSPLIQNGIGEVVHCSVPEVLLRGKLHIDYILFPCGGPDADIKDGLALFLRGAEVLDILKIDIFYVSVPRNVIEKGDV